MRLCGRSSTLDPFQRATPSSVPSFLHNLEFKRFHVRAWGETGCGGLLKQSVKIRSTKILTLYHRWGLPQNDWEMLAFQDTSIFCLGNPPTISTSSPYSLRVWYSETSHHPLHPHPHVETPRIEATVFISEVSLISHHSSNLSLSVLCLSEVI